MYEGYIYCITNNVNGKQYVGQTLTTIRNRFRQHKSDSRKYNYPLYNAFNKYGINSFSVIELRKIEQKDKKIMKNILDDLEISYISSYNTKIPNGYNILDGGNSNNGETSKIKVYRFDLEGNLLKVYNSATEIHDVDINVNNVGKVCRSGSLFSKGYLWSYNKTVTKQDIKIVHKNLEKLKNKRIKILENLNLNNIGHPREVYQFTLDGIFVKKWNSIKNASLHVSNGKGAYYLQSALSGECHQACGYLWSYTKESPEKYIGKSYCKSVKQYDMNFNYIQTFNSITDACRAIGIKNIQSITNCCRGIVNQAYGYMWRYVGENDNNPYFYYEKMGYMKPVDMFDIEGNFICTYNDMIHISEKYNPSYILRCCNGKIKKAYNHISKFNKDIKASA